MAKNFRISLGAAGPVVGMPMDAKGNVIYTPDQVEAINREQNRRHLNGVEVRQMGAICGQLENARICVSAEPVARYVNIRHDTLMHICNRAMEMCDMCCTCTREESKQCELRRALELVPGVKEQGKEVARKDATRCPYRGMEMEVDVL